MSRSRRDFEGEPPDRDPRKLGLSSSGHCGRQLGFKYHGQAGEPLSWRALSIFSDGNYIQDQIRQWLHLYLKPECFYLADEELEVTLKTPKGREVKGHVDGVIHHCTDGVVSYATPGCHDPAHKPRLLEIKSMGSRGFSRLNHALRNGGIENSYVTQVSCYMKALNLDECIILVKCKDTSELFEHVLHRDDVLVDEALRRYDEVFDSASPDMVQRMYHPDEEGYLPWQCNYCAFVSECWKKYLPRKKREHLWVLDGDYQEATETT